MAASPAKLAQYICLYGAFVVAANGIKGPWWSWSRGTAIDMWTLTHILWGWLGARMDQSFGQQLALASSNEILEFFLRKYRPDLLWGEAEPGLNVPIDIAANALGWRMGAQNRPLTPKKDLG